MALATRSAIAVSTELGQTTLQRIPLSAYSSAAAFVSPTTACFDAQYGPSVAAPCQARCEPTFTTAPPPARYPPTEPSPQVRPRRCRRPSRSPLGPRVGGPPRSRLRRRRP